MSEAWLVLPGFIMWAIILLLPWRPWSTREVLEAGYSSMDLSGVTVLIPARNEEDVITKTLAAVSQQGIIHKIILIDDQSMDRTVQVATASGIPKLEIIQGEPLPEGWSGKLWALEQGYRRVESEYILLLDADIELAPGILSSLLEKSTRDDLSLVSLMASLRMQNWLEKLLMPPFIYFFKLLYPFALSNSRMPLVAAAAGGCILIRTRALKSIGGFSPLKTALIDDCSLAHEVKKSGERIWTGLTHGAISQRAYLHLASIWKMVARTAFTQLKYSLPLLLICTILLIIAFLLPVVSLFASSGTWFILAVLTLCIMWRTYLPILRYYNIGLFWVFTLPVAGALYLLMTWSSAIRYWQGHGAEWKERKYGKSG